MKKTLIAIIAIVFAAGLLYATQCPSGCAAPDSGSEQITENNKKNKKTVKEMNTIKLTEADFYTKIADVKSNPRIWKYLGDKPAIIDFYADWCGPCKALSPVLEELAGEYKDSVYIYKVNTEEERNLSAMFGIRSIPTLIFIPMEGDPQIAQGALPKAELKKAIDSFLLKK